jgi:alpha-1,2-mannosyltransferase
MTWSNPKTSPAEDGCLTSRGYNRLRARRMQASGMIEAMRSGTWLTRERLRVYPLLLGLGLGTALLGLIATRVGVFDHWGRPLGSDFSQIWIAGGEIWAGHPAQPYDNIAHAAAQAAVFGAPDSFYSWPYPPYFLAIAALAAMLPYLAALAAWQGATLLLYLGAVLRTGRGLGIERGTLMGLALVFPAVTVNLIHGHNGFLTTALLAGGAMLLPKRPILAGVLLGLLAYKPQLALAVPVILIAGGFWRSTMIAIGTVILATLATLAAFGIEPWQAFVASMAFTRHVVLEQGGPGFAKLQSPFAAVRLLGGGIPLAYAVQGIVTVAVLVALASVWKSHADQRLKVASLMVASLLTTPYSVDYDMVMLGPALAGLASFGLAHGFRPYGKTLLAAVWIMPLLARPVAFATTLPGGALLMIVLFWHIVGWALSTHAGDRLSHDPCRS